MEFTVQVEISKVGQNPKKELYLKHELLERYGYCVGNAEISNSENIEPRKLNDREFEVCKFSIQWKI